MDRNDATKPYAIDAQFTWTNVDAVDYTQNPVPPSEPILFLRYIGVPYETRAPALGEPDVIIVKPEPSTKA